MLVSRFFTFGQSQASFSVSPSIPCAKSSISLLTVTSDLQYRYECFVNLLVQLSASKRMSEFPKLFNFCFGRNFRSGQLMRTLTWYSQLLTWKFISGIHICTLEKTEQNSNMLQKDCYLCLVLISICDRETEEAINSVICSEENQLVIFFPPALLPITTTTADMPDSNTVAAVVIFRL